MLKDTCVGNCTWSCSDYRTRCGGQRYVEVNGPKPSITPPWPERQFYLTCSKREPSAEGPWSSSVMEGWEGLVTGFGILLGSSKERLRKCRECSEKCSVLRAIKSRGDSVIGCLIILSRR